MQGLEALYTEKDFVLPGQSLSSQLSLHGLPSSRAHCARPLPRVTFNKGNCAHCAEPLSLDTANCEDPTGTKIWLFLTVYGYSMNNFCIFLQCIA